ncbi:hypothetical protein Syun_003804 [Stephania yunnanensis]|uniref:Uncharacterized protein n=1 Tax=Stephania yunnanensis TaxID=152371 RepID=A0AAP0L3E6_9MAGN
MAKFCPELRVLGYVGDKEQRCSLRRMSVALSVGDWFFDRVGVSAIDCPYPCRLTATMQGEETVTRCAVLMMRGTDVVACDWRRE